jgi:hypothetical protein
MMIDPVLVVVPTGSTHLTASLVDFLSAPLRYEPRYNNTTKTVPHSYFRGKILHNKEWGFGAHVTSDPIFLKITFPSFQKNDFF